MRNGSARRSHFMLSRATYRFRKTAIALFGSVGSKRSSEVTEEMDEKRRLRRLFKAHLGRQPQDALRGGCFQKNASSNLRRHSSPTRANKSLDMDSVASSKLTRPQGGLAVREERLDARRRVDLDGPAESDGRDFFRKKAEEGDDKSSGDEVNARAFTHLKGSHDHPVPKAMSVD